MYALITLEKEIRKPKGVSYSFVKNKTMFQTYQDVLFESQKTFAETSKIQSKNHQLYTQSFLKKWIELFYRQVKSS